MKYHITERQAALTSAIREYLEAPDKKITVAYKSPWSLGIYTYTYCYFEVYVGRKEVDVVAWFPYEILPDKVSELALKIAAKQDFFLLQQNFKWLLGIAFHIDNRNRKTKTICEYIWDEFELAELLMDVYLNSIIPEFFNEDEGIIDENFWVTHFKKCSDALKKNNNK